MKKLIATVLICISATALNAAVSNHLSFGGVEIPDNVALVIINEDDEQVTITSAGGTSRVAVGKYQVDYWTIQRKGADGKIWQLRASDLGSKGLFEVVEGKRMILSVGEPVISALTAREDNSTYYLSYSLKGRLSETIEITQDGNGREAPKLHISNADKSYQQTLTFEYG